MTGILLGSNGNGVTAEERKRVLFVDDHEDTRDLVATLLGVRGYEVTTVGSASEALCLSESGGFDLFIVDGVLEDGLGTALCEQIRQFDTQTPILFLSALAYESDIAKAMNAGAQAYIAKPFELEMLEETITRLT